MRPTEAELAEIMREWQSFAQTKVFAFRGITPAAYEMFAPAYFKAIADRSEIEVYRNAEMGIFGVVIYEEIPDSNSAIVHWAWTAKQHRNMGIQKEIWHNLALDSKNVFISHLTVLSEKLCAKYGWLFNPFTLYWSSDDQTSRAHDSKERREDTGEPGQEHE